MPRLTHDAKRSVLAAIRDGKTVPEIHAMTGVPKRTIAYTAAATGLTIRSRYNRLIPGSYWQQLRGRYWAANAH